MPMFSWGEICVELFHFPRIWDGGWRWRWEWRISKKWCKIFEIGLGKSRLRHVNLWFLLINIQPVWGRIAQAVSGHGSWWVVDGQLVGKEISFQRFDMYLDCDTWFENSAIIITCRYHHSSPSPSQLPHHTTWMLMLHDANDGIPAWLTWELGYPWPVLQLSTSST